MCRNRNIKALGSVEMHTVYVVFLEFRTSFKLMKRGLQVIKSRLQPGEKVCSGIISIKIDIAMLICIKYY